MATKKQNSKTSKKVVKKTKKLAKKKPKVFIALLILVILACVCVFVLWKLDIISFNQETETHHHEEKVYSFSNDVSCYKVEYNEETQEFTVTNDTNLDKGNNYILAKEVENVVSLYILDSNETKEKEVGSMPTSISSEYIWTYYDTKDNENRFTKYYGIAENVIYDDF